MELIVIGLIIILIFLIKLTNSSNKELDEIEEHYKELDKWYRNKIPNDKRRSN